MSIFLYGQYLAHVGRISRVNFNRLVQMFRHSQKSLVMRAGDTLYLSSLCGFPGIYAPRFQVASWWMHPPRWPRTISGPEASLRSGPTFLMSAMIL